MQFRTTVDIGKPSFLIEPLEPLLFVGSCFAESIGRRFAHAHFPAVVNPHGVMYNPASVLHSVERFLDRQCPRIVFLTLGTNHVYRLRETWEIVDNCGKRPQTLFVEEELSAEQCAHCLCRAVHALRCKRGDVQVVVTVSPIRYAKYGFHGSQLSKATLLLATDMLVRQCDNVTYFPAYEIVTDELRDYRFYQPDMTHPSEQAVDYIWERLADTFFSPRTMQFIDEWRPICQALGHRPLNPDSKEYLAFLAVTLKKERDLLERYGRGFSPNGKVQAGGR